MKKTSTYFLKIVCLMLILPCVAPFTSPLCAETWYVSDMLILSVREGPGKEFNTLLTLRSNAAVDILEKKSGYFKVKTENGDRGWVQSQYLSPELPKTMIIDQLQTKLEQFNQLKSKLEEQNKLLNKQNADLVNQNTDLVNKSGNVPNGQQSREDSNMIQGEKEYQEKIATLEADLEGVNKNLEMIESELKHLQQKHLKLLSDSENIIRITEEYEKLKQESEKVPGVGKLTDITDIFMVAAGDDVLKTAMIKWFLSGAGVLIAGWWIGKNFSGGGSRKRGLIA